MGNYLLRRIFLLIPTLLGVTIITFLLIKSIPGDPALGLVGERASADTVNAIRSELGSDRSFFLQYWGYLRLVMQGELGRSYYTNRKVSEDIREKLPNTFRLAVAAMVFASLLGILLGVLQAVNRGKFWDLAGSVLSVGGISLPVFWVGLILMLIFSFVLRLLPPSGMGDGHWIYLVLPASTLGLNSAAYIARITRASVLEVISQAFIVTARAKGLPERSVILKHALKNAMIPILTLIGIDFGSYLNGAVLTETIFGWDGLGRYALDGIMKRDYPVVMGSVLTGALVFILVNVMVDVSYGWLNPRIRLQNGTDQTD